jgi:hypothetical protein
MRHAPEAKAVQPRLVFISKAFLPCMPAFSACPKVRTISLLFWRDLAGRFTGRHRIGRFGLDRFARRKMIGETSPSLTTPVVCAKSA